MRQKHFNDDNAAETLNMIGKVGSKTSGRESKETAQEDSGLKNESWKDEAQT